MPCVDFRVHRGGMSCHESRLRGRTYIAFLLPLNPWEPLWNASAPLGTVVHHTAAGALRLTRGRWASAPHAALRVTPASNPPTGFLVRALALDGAALLASGRDS
jgi:hypothetical protein